MRCARPGIGFCCSLSSIPSMTTRHLRTVTHCPFAFWFPLCSLVCFCKLKSKVSKIKYLDKDLDCRQSRLCDKAAMQVPEEWRSHSQEQHPSFSDQTSSPVHNSYLRALGACRGCPSPTCQCSLVHEPVEKSRAPPFGQVAAM